MMKNIFKQIIPPFLLYTYRSIVDAPIKNKLFRGNGAYFEKRLLSSKFYGEYGCGASTIWVANNCAAQIISVDSSKFWINKIKQDIPSENKIELIHVDLGELGDWGRPVDYTHRSKINDYLNAPWSDGAKPDTILVDGRFRVACFFTSLLAADPGSIIIFDDYADRKHYHLVEEFVSCDQIFGDQAIFTVPSALDRTAIEQELAKFVYVMD